jgi:hypothetical protein
MRQSTAVRSALSHVARAGKQPLHDRVSEQRLACDAGAQELGALESELSQDLMRVVTGQ